MRPSNSGHRRSWSRRLVLAGAACVAVVAAGLSAGTPAHAAAPSPMPATAITPLAPDSPAASAAAIVCAKVAAKAGFSFADTLNTSQGAVRQIVIAVAVAMAESSCNPGAVFTNPGGCRDRGLWQIDDCAHPNVTDTCAFQVQCNADAAWLISGKGTNWQPWSTFNSGRWVTYLSTARDAINGFSFQLKSRGAGTCLDAKASDVGNGGAIIQWACNSGDSYQQWRVVVANGFNPVLQNVGAGTCLDAKASDVGNGGAIIQWACDTTGDTFQRWRLRGSGQLNTNGNANAGLENSGSHTCLDAKASDVGNGGAIIQWSCDSSDRYQLWN